MALDEVLLDSMPLDHARPAAAREDSAITLRRTVWESPSATIGRFQPYTEFDIAGETRPSIRRITGGGAILHHDELTIAIVAPTPSPLFPDSSALALANHIADQIGAVLAEELPTLARRGGEPDERSQIGVLDCFERRSPFDLIDGDGNKAVGLALHRRAHQVLVQGSIRRDPLKLEPAEDEKTLRMIAQGLGTRMWKEDEFTAEEIRRGHELVQARYGRQDWNRRR